MTGRAAIIGGGIGGLAAAVALRRHGWQVTLWERDTGLPTTGTALGIWPAALTALDALGVGDEVRRVAQRQRCGRFSRPDGSTIADIDVDRLERRAGDGVHLVSRPALLDILGRAAGAATLRFGSPIHDVRTISAQFDVVVAADGVFSRTREELFGAGTRAYYSGSTAWRGSVDDLPTDTFVEVWGRGVKFGVTPQEGGRTNWYAAAAAPERDFSPGRELAALRAMFAGWAAPVSTVLGAIDESAILRHDVHVTPPLRSYVHGNVALIGDAAHAMTPDLGRGACEAVIDAVTLAGPLVGAGSVPDALSAYDRRRRRTTRRLARMSTAAARLSRIRRGLPIRDALLRASMLAGPPA